MLLLVGTCGHHNHSKLSHLYCSASFSSCFLRPHTPPFPPTPYLHWPKIDVFLTKISHHLVCQGDSVKPNTYVDK